MKRVIVVVGLLMGFYQGEAQPLSKRMATTVMNLWKDSFSLTPGRSARWSYDQGVILKGFEGLWKRTGDPLYFNYIQKSMDFFVEDNGQVKSYKPSEYNIDHVNNARILLTLYRVTGKEKYWKAATQMRDQLRTHPRTSEGGFWHKQVYPHQMWLDGLYMGQPFYAEYSFLSKDDTAYNDIAKQFILMEKHSRDDKTGLLYHGWDESKQQKWADKETGRSPHFWGRAMGWYAMALVDVLDYFPNDHPQRKELVAILQRLAAAIKKVQDPKTGVWYDILDKADYKGNYVEASASSMFVFSMAKGIRKGYLAENNLPWVRKAWDGIVKQFIVAGGNGGVNLNGTVSVSGLGGSPNYRDGSMAYYLSEKVIQNDPKGIGAFLQAANEMEMLPSLYIGKGKTVLLDNYYNHETKKDVTGQSTEWHYTWSDMSNGGFSLLGNIFEQNGASLATLKTAPTAASLSKAGVYLIVDPDHEKDNPKPNYMQQEDASVIRDWVKNGGILALFANDSSNAELTRFNILAGMFGIRFNPDLKNTVEGNKFEQGAIAIAPRNPVFKTAKKVYIKELSTLKLIRNSDAIVRHKGQDIIAVSRYGKGLVFAVGDPWFYNEYIDGRKLPVEFDNYAAATDFVKWILSIKK